MHRCSVPILVLLAGCAPDPAPEPESPISTGRSDPDQVRAADIRIVFVGNSHTTFHNVPNLVAELIRMRRPGKTVFTHVIPTPHLDVAAQDPACREEIETRPWTFVVLQAQRISMSGKFNYSRSEGIELAKLARAHGATVYFFSEWGLKDIAGDAARNERIYTEMAREAGVRVATVGRAWDLALADRPEVALHAADGNHQSAMGAFLTACVLAGTLTGEDPTTFANYPYSAAGEADRRFLAAAAARAINPKP
jgi:hypothetical protein